MHTLHQAKNRSAMELLRKYAVIVTAAVMILVATAVTGGSFLSGSNLLNVGERAAAIGIVALGQMLVILTGGIDLSVGGTIAVAWAVTDLLTTKITTIPIPVAIALMLLVTTACGAFNGLLVSFTKIPPFMLTLGTRLIYTSLAFVICSATNLGFERQSDWLIATFGLEGTVARVFPTVMWVVISAIVIFVLAYTRFGKNTYATGGGELAARYSGINTKLQKFKVYTLCGLLCGVAALLLEFRLRNVNATSAASYQIDSIAAVIVGGASLSGGEGNVYGTFVGAFIMAALVNMLNLAGVDVYSQDIYKGVILIACIFLTQVLTRMNKNK